MRPLTRLKRNMGTVVLASLFSGCAAEHETVGASSTFRRLTVARRRRVASLTACRVAVPPQSPLRGLTRRRGRTLTRASRGLAAALFRVRATALVFEDDCRPVIGSPFHAEALQGGDVGVIDAAGDFMGKSTFVNRGSRNGGLQRRVSWGQAPYSVGSVPIRGHQKR